MSIKQFVDKIMSGNKYVDFNYPTNSRLLFQTNHDKVIFLGEAAWYSILSY